MSKRKFEVETNHGTFRMEGENEADVRYQAENLTYGPTTVHRIDEIGPDGKTFWDNRMAEIGLPGMFLPRRGRI